MVFLRNQFIYKIQNGVFVYWGSRIWKIKKKSYKIFVVQKLFNMPKIAFSLV